MKEQKTYPRFFSAFVLIMIILLSFQSAEPWTAKQMVSPYDLSQRMQKSKEKLPLILSIGPQAVIKGSKDIGPGQDPDNIKKLKMVVNQLPKDTEIILYCGCCPLQKCPNVRPAFKTLNDLGFKNHKLLAILNNVKTDWINKGYPVQD
ncbi:rhodanese-like domain-containing protein [Echinicola sp. 20G]|uniref:rhodanese-like domain-containing protein n=1 Tax=Echinicola sp. 20G TaxID=2781961 RepID=UPI001910BF68|nr:rhodanese-like domain-containing protein [Echinicola sp. 20G]